MGWRNLIEVQAFATLALTLLLSTASAVNKAICLGRYQQYTEQYARSADRAEEVLSKPKNFWVFLAVSALVVLASVFLLIQYKHLPSFLSILLAFAGYLLIVKIRKWQAVLVVISGLEVVTIMPSKSTPLAIVALQAICIELVSELAKRYEQIKIISSIVLWGLLLIVGSVIDTLAITRWSHCKTTVWWRQIPQAYNIGLLTPIIGCMLFAAIALWSARLANMQLRLWPQIGALCGVAAGFAATGWLHCKYGNAALIAAGAIFGLIAAVIKTGDYMCFGSVRFYGFLKWRR